MGRGRQKAKHMKVARRLKYYSPETDLDALQRELTMSGDSKPEPDDASLAAEGEDEWADDPWDAQSTSYSQEWSKYQD